jgi:hypothetical protein
MSTLKIGRAVMALTCDSGTCLLGLTACEEEEEEKDFSSFCTLDVTPIAIPNPANKSECCPALDVEPPAAVLSVLNKSFPSPRFNSSKSRRSLMVNTSASIVVLDVAVFGMLVLFTMRLAIMSSTDFAAFQSRG